MDRLNAFSRRRLLWVLLINLLFFGIIDGGIYYAAGWIFGDVSFAQVMGILSRSAEAKDWVSDMLPVFSAIRTFFIPVTAGVFMLLALFEWLVLRSSFKRLIRKAAESKEPAAGKAAAQSGKAEAEQSGVGPKQLEEQNKRYYLHLLSVLQREGRLIDFFKEDLSAYADAQIGAAVRSIHENCAKTVEKYISPKGVIDKPEGEQVTVPPDFDPGAIKLTGNVTGEPPFTGVLRHRGWRAGKVELPVLSGGGDMHIIAPAEVEIS